MKIFYIISFVVVSSIGIYILNQPTPPNPANTTVIKKIEPAMDPSMVKTFERVLQDIEPENNKPFTKDGMTFFENDKKEIFTYYMVQGARAVAKFNGQKWVYLQSWNGSPDCLILDKAGVPYQKSTIEFGCQIDGTLRADLNPKDKKAYEEFWSK